jgi:hypothetical protein
MTGGRWVYTGSQKKNKPPGHEKREIGEACETFIENVLKPQFLPEIRPTQFNYCVDIFGKWYGGKYRFMQRFRNDDRERFVEPEFDAPFARLDYVGHDRFDLAYFRHTGQWWTVHRGVSLAEALNLFETEGIFHPTI